MDAHFKESGKVDVDRDALKNFARYELQMPEESLRNLGLILPEVAFFDSSDITNLSTYSVYFRESKLWLPTKQRPNLNYARMVFVFRYSLVYGI